jgi:hypothetical protein
MFHPELNPEDVLTYVFSDMKGVLQDMRKVGADLQNTPSHCAGVYLLLSNDDPDQVGLCRGEPNLLDAYAKSEWANFGLYYLHQGKSHIRIPIGVFIGFIKHIDITNKNSLDSFVGVLISPTGTEAVSCFSTLKDLDLTRKLKSHAFDQFPSLLPTFILAENVSAH